MAVGRVTIPDQVFWRFIPREGFGDLASDPFRRRIGRHRERYQPPALMPENDQDEEQLETNRRHDQEIHGGDAGRMIVQKGLPSLRPPSPVPRHILGDRRLRDVDPELEQFAMDSRRAPQPVGQAHVADQTPDLDWNLWPAATRARLPAPICQYSGLAGANQPACA